MQLPLTLRLVYHGARALIRAALLFFCAWLLLIPATAEEKRTLGAQAHEQYPEGLRPMRTARAVVNFAPDRVYVLMARAAGPEASPFLIRIMMMQIATGQIRPGANQAGPNSTIERSTAPQSDRSIEGPRFIQVD